MSRPSIVLERRMFKAVPGGYIFQPVPPTAFHRTQAYVVDEAKKAEILAITRRGRALWTRTVAYTAMALAAATGVLTNAYGAAIVASVVIGLCAWFVAQVLGTALVWHLKLRQLEPALAGLRPSDERLFPGRQILSGKASPFAIAVSCALFGFLLGEHFERHSLFTVESAILLIGLAVNLLGALGIAPAGAGIKKAH